MSAPPSLGFGLRRLDESEDKEEVRDVVLSGVGTGRLSSSGWLSTPTQREELVRATHRALENSGMYLARETEEERRVGTCPESGRGQD